MQPEARSAPFARIAASCLQCCIQIKLGERNRWSPGEKQSCEEGNYESKSQYVGVRTNRFAAWQIPYIETREEPHDVHCESQAKRSSYRGKEQVFGDELPHDATARCAQA